MQNRSIQGGTSDFGDGDGLPANAADVQQLFGAIYPDLCGLAEQWLRRRPAITVLEPKVLVHEVYMKLASSTGLSVKSRTHFFALAARAMRQILVDLARRRIAQKRGAGQGRLTLSGLRDKKQMPALDIVALDEALSELASLHPRHAQVVEMRFFAGMELSEIALALGVSPRTVDADWAAARAWLFVRLRAEERR